MHILKLITYLVVLFISTIWSLSAQEICDNAIDDDGDGLVDFNDDDCICLFNIESSLIPNFSFEERSCCPNANGMLNCADDWIQASNPTTDYIHTCSGYMGNTNINAMAPLPLADGEGAVGFRDGEPGSPNFKEYVGTCLTDNMVIGTEYRLDFFVGFQKDKPASNSIDLAIFGSVDCSDLPFGNNSNSIGCPVNTGEYDELGGITVSGNDEWVNVILDFEPEKEYNVFIVGPACPQNPKFGQNPYFYIDRLALNEKAEFGLPLEEVSGQICQDDLIISVEETPNSIFQWYLNGVALIGETNHDLELDSSDPEGTYMVSVITDDDCGLSQEYILRIPPYYFELDTVICSDEFLMIGNMEIIQDGYQEITIEALDGCDSIIQLNLTINKVSEIALQEDFCPGTMFTFLDISTDQAGIYTTTLTNSVGCDSIITIDLKERILSGSIELAELIDANLGDIIDINPTLLNTDFVDFQWYAINNELIGENLILSDFLALVNTTLRFEAFDDDGCSIIKFVEIRVNKENVKMYIPNIFSPNNDGVNDRFNIFSTQSLKLVQDFAIYDRWGNKVFQETDIENLSTFQGWDGSFNNRPVQSGIYSYYIDAEFLDGSIQKVTGNVTIIR